MQAGSDQCLPTQLLVTQVSQINVWIGFNVDTSHSLWKVMLSHFHNSNAPVPGDNMLCMQPKCFGISTCCLRQYTILLRCPYGFQYWLCTLYLLAGSWALRTIIPNPYRLLNKNQLQLISGKRPYLQELKKPNQFLYLGCLWQFSFYLSFTENY